MRHRLSVLLLLPADVCRTFARGRHMRCCRLFRPSGHCLTEPRLHACTYVHTSKHAVGYMTQAYCRFPCLTTATCLNSRSTFHWLAPFHSGHAIPGCRFRIRVEHLAVQRHYIVDADAFLGGYKPCTRMMIEHPGSLIRAMLLRCLGQCIDFGMSLVHE